MKNKKEKRNFFGEWNDDIQKKLTFLKIALTQMLKAVFVMGINSLTMKETVT